VTATVAGPRGVGRHCSGVRPGRRPPVAQHPGRDAGGGAVLRHVPGHHGAGPDDGIPADAHAVHHLDVGPQPGVVFNDDTAHIWPWSMTGMSVRSDTWSPPPIT
jgi:hypothetical protein